MEKPELKINPETLDNIKCECGGDLWIPLYFMKRVPALMVGAPEDVVAPVESGNMACINCRKPISEAIRALKDQQELSANQAKHGIIT